MSCEQEICDSYAPHLLGSVSFLLNVSTYVHVSESVICEG